MTRMLRNLARFIRIGMAPLTISVPILGALVTETQPTFGQILSLGLIGLSAHSFGFGLNDLMDFRLDRTLSIRQFSPLISGRLSKGVAWGFVLLQIPLSTLIYLLAFDSSTGVLILCFSIAMSTVYNLFSKWGRIPRIFPEVALAGSIGLLCAVGAVSVGALTAITAVYALTLALILLLLNSVPSGLKDLKTDLQFGARSFLIAAGSTLTDDDHYILPRSVILYAVGLQLTILAGIILLIGQLSPAWWAVMLILLCLTFGTLHLRMLLTVRSFDAVRRSLPLLNGYYNYVAMVLLLAHRMHFLLQLLILLIALRLCLVPLSLSRRVWRARHAPIYQ